MQSRKIVRSFHVVIPLISLSLLFGIGVLSDACAADKSSRNRPSELIAEVRKSFTIGGKPIPPEIFCDFGDGDMADSGGIWITVDAAAAIDSNLYGDPIKQNSSFVTQGKAGPDDGFTEQTSYSYWGANRNGLLVLIASYSGGGSGIFYTMHIVDVAAGRAFDLDGKVYQRIDLTNVRSVILGDRWEGELKISGNAIKIITTRNGPTDNGARQLVTIVAQRP